MSTHEKQDDLPQPTRDEEGPNTTERVMTQGSTRATWWLTGGSVLLAGAFVATLVAFFQERSEHLAPDPAPVAGLETPAAEEHVDQVAELIEHTRAAREGLVPVLEFLDEIPPTDDSSDMEDLPSLDDIDERLRAVRDARAHLDHAETGETGFDVTQAGLRGSVDVLYSALNAYRAAGRSDGDRRAELLELATDLRDQAVRAWSVAATQLDLISIDAGHGHIHLYLPGPADVGAMEPDDARDGDQAVDEVVGGPPGQHDH
ncbi:hypothetical protein [Nocardiopsis alkaliphila]|uniref:hypothetical protein n=1 Tax=Nocardiopsis alkaliphila TaxID=225762 RepID=UPI000347E6BF|nr:hypothetical protein [Nocardiopsis alkaliphila]